MGKFAEHNVAMGAVFDQDASSADLQAIAEEQPGLRHLVAGHRNTSPATLAWLAQSGDPNVAKVLESRGLAVPAGPKAAPIASKRSGNSFAPAVIGVVAVIVVVALVVAGLRFGFGASESSPSTSAPSTAEPDYPSLQTQLVTLVGGTGFDSFTDVALTPDGGFVAVGYTYSNEGALQGSEGGSAMVVMFDSGGNVLWTRTMEDEGQSRFAAVAVGPDGSVYAVGSTSPPMEDEQCGYIALMVKLTPAGDMAWYWKSYHECSHAFMDVVVTDDWVNVVGYTTSGTDEDGVLLEGYYTWFAGFSFDGTYMWGISNGGTGNDYLRAVTQSPDGTVVAVGVADSYGGDFAGNADNDGLIAGFTTEGDLEWSRTFYGDGYDSFSSVVTTPDNRLIIVGNTTSRKGDLGYASVSGESVGILGVYTDERSPVTFHASQKEGASAFWDAAVTADGLAVAVGGENWMVGILNLNDKTMSAAKASPPGLPQGEYFAVEVIEGNRLVAVGHANKGMSEETEKEDCDAALVIFTVA